MRALNRAVRGVRGAMLLSTLVLCVAAFTTRPTRSSRPPRAQDDVTAITQVIESVRGAAPLLCEMAVRTVENQWGWGGYGADFRTSREPGVRHAMVLVNQRKAGAEAVPVLRAALADADACVRRLAAPLLGRIDHASAKLALRQALRDERPETREAAAYGLGYSEDPAVIPALLAGLQDPLPRIRIACAWALGEIEDSRAIGALVRLLREDRDPDVRSAAAWALGEIEG